MRFWLIADSPVQHERKNIPPGLRLAYLYTLNPKPSTLNLNGTFAKHTETVSPSPSSGARSLDAFPLDGSDNSIQQDWVVEVGLRLYWYSAWFGVRPGATLNPKLPARIGFLGLASGNDGDSSAWNKI